MIVWHVAKPFEHLYSVYASKHLQSLLYFFARTCQPRALMKATAKHTNWHLLCTCRLAALAVVAQLATRATLVLRAFRVTKATQAPPVVLVSKQRPAVH